RRPPEGGTTNGGTTDQTAATDREGGRRSPLQARQNGTRPRARKCPKPRNASQLFSARACCPRQRRHRYCTPLPTNCTGASSVTTTLYNSSPSPEQPLLRR